MVADLSVPSFIFVASRCAWAIKVTADGLYRQGILSIDIRDQWAAAHFQVDAIIVLAFSLFGVLFDVVSMCHLLPLPCSH